MNHAHIGLTDKDRAGSGEILNQLLADQFLLYTKTLNFHWNVVGLQFNDLHKFFEHQYEDLFEMIDLVAERARAMDVFSLGTMQEFTAKSKLREEPGVVPSSSGMIKRLLDDHETIIRSLRIAQETAMNTYHDAGTNNFLTDIMERHEKMAWMLRSFLQTAPH